MRKRHWIVGLLALVGSAVSYGLALMTAATPSAAAAAEMESSASGVGTTASTLIVPSLAVSIESLFASAPDPVVLLVTGMALIGVAEGVRRRTC